MRRATKGIKADVPTRLHEVEHVCQSMFVQKFLAPRKARNVFFIANKEKLNTFKLKRFQEKVVI